MVLSSMTTGSKERVAIHEAGHSTLNLVFRFPFEFAEVYEKPDGSFSGRTYSSVAYDVRDKKMVLKEVMTELAGFCAEEVFCGRKLDISIDSPGSSRDFYRAQQLCTNIMAREFFDKVFVNQLIPFVKEILKANWNKCVIPFKEKLMSDGVATVQFFNSHIGGMYDVNEKPFDELIDFMERHKN